MRANETEQSRGPRPFRDFRSTDVGEIPRDISSRILNFISLMPDNFAVTEIREPVACKRASYFIKAILHVAVCVRAPR